MVEVVVVVVMEVVVVVVFELIIIVVSVMRLYYRKQIQSSYSLQDNNIALCIISCRGNVINAI